MVTAGVHENAMEPGLEASLVAEGVPLPPGDDIRVVHGILGRDLAAHDRPGQSVAGVEVPATQAAKRHRPVVGRWLPGIG